MLRVYLKLLFLVFLAHLSRRRICELVVYACLRRPATVHPSTISNDFSSEAEADSKYFDEFSFWTLGYLFSDFINCSFIGTHGQFTTSLDH